MIHCDVICNEKWHTVLLRKHATFRSCSTNCGTVPQFVELRPAYRTCSTFWGAVQHFWDAVPQIVELFHKRVEMFHFLSVFLDTAQKFTPKVPHFTLRCDISPHVECSTPRYDISSQSTTFHPKVRHLTPRYDTLPQGQTFHPNDVTKTL